jgi:hypothetical protein
MGRYKVEVMGRQPVVATVHVNADNEDEACEKALEKANESTSVKACFVDYPEWDEVGEVEILP